MTVNIKKNPLFHTPTSQDELLNYLERFTGGERLAAITAMGMTWNLLAELVAQGHAQEATSRG